MMGLRSISFPLLLIKKMRRSEVKQAMKVAKALIEGK